MEKKTIIDYLKAQEDRRAEYVHSTYDHEKEEFVHTEFDIHYM